jgi:hypothetical protein
MGKKILVGGDAVAAIGKNILATGVAATGTLARAAETGEAAANTAKHTVETADSAVLLGKAGIDASTKNVEAAGELVKSGLDVTKKNVEAAGELNNTVINVTNDLTKTTGKLANTTGNIANETTQNTGNIINSGLSNISNIFGSILGIITSGFTVFGTLITNKTQAYVANSAAQKKALEEYLDSGDYTNQQALIKAKETATKNFIEIMDTFSITLMNIKKNCNVILDNLIIDYEYIHKCRLRSKIITITKLCESNPLSLKIMNKQQNINRTIDQYKNKIELNKTLITSNITAITRLDKFYEQIKLIEHEYVTKFSNDITEINNNFEADLKNIVDELASITTTNGGKNSHRKRTYRKKSIRKHRKKTKKHML